eukprot:3201912-Lingulodinium_polyedra.AAC.1
MSFHQPRMKEASCEEIKNYASHLERAWPSFTGTSQQKLLGEQVLFNSAGSPWAALKAWHGSFLHKGLLARPTTGGQWQW